MTENLDSTGLEKLRKKLARGLMIGAVAGTAIFAAGCATDGGSGPASSEEGSSGVKAASGERETTYSHKMSFPPEGSEAKPAEGSDA